MLVTLSFLLATAGSDMNYFYRPPPPPHIGFHIDYGKSEYFDPTFGELELVFRPR